MTTKKAVPHQGHDWPRGASVMERPNVEQQVQQTVIEAQQAPPEFTTGGPIGIGAIGTTMPVDPASIPQNVPPGQMDPRFNPPEPPAAVPQLAPADSAAQAVAEQYREWFRRTRGLEEYLACVRAAFHAGMLYAADSTIFNRPAYLALAPSSTYQPDGTYAESILH